MSFGDCGRLSGGRRKRGCGHERGRPKGPLTTYGVLEALPRERNPRRLHGRNLHGVDHRRHVRFGVFAAEMRAIVESGVCANGVIGPTSTPSCMPYYRTDGGVLPSFLSGAAGFRHTKPGQALRGSPRICSPPRPEIWLLMELFAPATAPAGGRFDDLMVPSLCGERLNARRGVGPLRDGDLAEAVRSCDVDSAGCFKPMKSIRCCSTTAAMHHDNPRKAARLRVRGPT